MKTLEPYSLGYYINNEDVLTYPKCNSASFSEKNWLQLRALGKRYNP